MIASAAPIMAEPLGEKAKVIRQALAAYPKVKNTHLADTINNALARSSYGIEGTANDVAQQKQAIKTAVGGTPAEVWPAPAGELQVPVAEEEPVRTPKKRGRKPVNNDRQRAAVSAAAPVSAPSPSARWT